MTIIYHGTPLTPRAALLDVCAGRAMCVSFFRPDDVEAVGEISPAVMFRQRSIFVLAGGPSARRGMGRTSRLVIVFRLAGASPVHAGTLGSYTGHAGSAIPAQRQFARRLALRTEGCAALAHGRADRTALAPVRSVRPGLSRMGRRWQDAGQSRVSRAHGGSRQGARQPLACVAHDARNDGGLRLPVRQCGQHITRTERVAL